MAKTSKLVAARPYKSEFGSHSEMIVMDVTGEDTVTCKDQFGEYITERWRIDTNMADPNRCAGSRVKLN